MLFVFTAAVFMGMPDAPAAASTRVTGQIIDRQTGQPVPARLYIRGPEGWLHATSSGGKAVPYHRDRGTSVEIHTALSAHPFAADLPPGRYTLTAERGHEYLPVVQSVQVGNEPVHIELALRRWINMSVRGWYSGDTHVHRTLAELPTAMLAEDLNVALPLTAWVTDTEQVPSRSNKNPEPVPAPELIRVDANHVIWPINTEYEIFTVKRQRHTLGAVFVLNHRQQLDLKAPPVTPIARRARDENALLDMDKHNWPWSMMLMPTMQVDLFELSNNHIWRTEFLFHDWYPEYAEDWMGIDNSDGLSEEEWIHFGFHTYYALLNCGFRIRPSAGTASGVHPVPPGFGRVYVHTPERLDYARWIDGLRNGRSFVTTGPMLDVRANGTRSDVTLTGDGAKRVEVSATIESVHPLSGVELVINSEIMRLTGTSEKTAAGTFQTTIDVTVEPMSSGWLCLRCFEERPDGRIRFAHSAPFFIEQPDRPLRPRSVEVDYLVRRVRDEIERHRNVLDSESLAEYERALKFYEDKLATAR